MSVIILGTIYVTLVTFFSTKTRGKSISWKIIIIIIRIRLFGVLARDAVLIMFSHSVSALKRLACFSLIRVNQHGALTNLQFSFLKIKSRVQTCKT